MTKMTDAQMLKNLLAVYECMVNNRLNFRAPASHGALKEVIAELRRRIALEERT